MSKTIRLKAIKSSASSGRAIPGAILAICLAVSSLCGCSAMLAKNSRLSISQGVPGKLPARGLKVTQVLPNSAAESAGIHTLDLITRYGDYEIVDDASYFAAREHYEKSLNRTVEIVVWRGLLRMSTTVPTGWLGVMTVDSDKVSDAFLTLMNHVNAMDQIPQYMHDREFKGQFDEGPAKVLERAKALIDVAEREGTLTPAQLLVDRIYLILDDAPIADQKRQTELLNQLIATQPVSYIHMLANDRFFKDRRYRAAIPCFEHYLKTSPDDVSMRLNLAAAYNRVGMYDQAESTADYVFVHKLGLSDYGYVVAYTNKAIASLGQKDYRKSIQFSEKAFAIDHDPDHLLTEQLAAAQTGDMEVLEAAKREFQRVDPNRYRADSLKIDAVEAYALVKGNRRAAAMDLARKWQNSDRAEGRVVAAWRSAPDGMDVAKNWSDLMRNLSSAGGRLARMSAKR